MHSCYGWSTGFCEIYRHGARAQEKNHREETLSLGLTVDAIGLLGNNAIDILREIVVMYAMSCRCHNTSFNYTTVSASWKYSIIMYNIQ